MSQARVREAAELLDQLLFGPSYISKRVDNMEDKVGIRRLGKGHRRNIRTVPLGATDRKLTELPKRRPRLSSIWLLSMLVTAACGAPADVTTTTLTDTSPPSTATLLPSTTVETTIPPTTTSLLLSTTAQPVPSAPATTISDSVPASAPYGLVGCSMTRDAIDGYIQLGGTLFWDVDDEYGNGSVTKWSLPNSIFWGRFDHFLGTYSNPQYIWWQLCTAQTENTTIEMTETILARIRDRLPDTPLWISAQPDYVGGEDCGISGPDGPEMMAALAKELIEMGIGEAGPIQGPLERSETTDGCHANEAGQAILGGQVEQFLNGLES